MAEMKRDRKWIPVNRIPVIQKPDGSTARAIRLTPSEWEVIKPTLKGHAYVINDELNQSRYENAINVTRTLYDLLKGFSYTALIMNYVKFDYFLEVLFTKKSDGTILSENEMTNYFRGILVNAELKMFKNHE